ncbi:ABC transporter substrate-binding protein [Teichococcus vastitatis]|uniref:ABC transporter substrate-binding protein n=1 Tax=Teichococcus vastitatis TaxID=2307076 RepID=A0ABS9W7S7_9PROT|nr:ABC transporter substrate-binding protein [Pseudoroseomonas vastitatis]MCI0755276.1 ABC transporter substrate-binding protein [Pseudoroseomonas vastitatis]
MSIRRRALIAASLAAPLLRPLSAGAAETRPVTDITGRTVQVKREVRRVILGEGRQIYLLAALDREAPFGRVVGWRDDFRKADFDGYTAYQRRWPEIDQLPTFGGVKDGTFDVEQAISLRPDVIIMNLESKVATEEGGLIAKLAAVNVPVLFIDFRERPFENAERSIHIMGEVMGREERAEELAAFRRQEVDRVTARLTGLGGPRPKVMIERAAGYDESCCMSFGDENFGRMVKVAGGDNIAEKLIPGTFGIINPEQVIAANPDVVIATGSNWKLYAPGGAWVGVGPGADPKVAAERLRALMRRPAYSSLPVRQTGRVHAIWHQFYDSPYQFVAVQVLAKWIHPELFADLDPDATFRRFHERFLPVAYQPGYWVTATRSA